MSAEPKPPLAGRFSIGCLYYLGDFLLPQQETPSYSPTFPLDNFFTLTANAFLAKRQTPRIVEIPLTTHGIGSWSRYFLIESHAPSTKSRKPKIPSVEPIPFESFLSSPALDKVDALLTNNPVPNKIKHPLQIHSVAVIGSGVRSFKMGHTSQGRRKRGR